MSKEYYYTKNKDDFMGSENRKVRKKKSETCEDQLRRLCKDIAEDITAGKISADKWMDCVYDIEWTTHRDHEYRSARLLVAGGEPTIWVNMMTTNVEGYWGTDKVKHSFDDNIGLDDYLLDMHANETEDQDESN